MIVLDLGDTLINQMSLLIIGLLGNAAACVQPEAAHSSTPRLLFTNAALREGDFPVKLLL